MSFGAFAARAAAALVLSFTCVAALADAVSVAAGVRAGASDVILVFVASAAWAAPISAGAGALVLLCGSLFSLAARAPERRVRLGVVGASLPVVLGLVAGGLDLLSGQGISGKSWVGMARLAWVVCAPAGFLAVTQVLAAAIWMTTGRRRTAMRWVVASAAASVVVAALVADRGIYPTLYPAGHLLLWLCVFTATFVVAALVAGLARPSTTVLAAGAGALLAWSALALLLVPPLDDAPLARAAAYRETLFLKRALTHLKPAAKAVPLEPDPGVVRDLQAARQIDAAVLDRALPGRRRMNVLLVSIDALRTDRLGRNGAARRLTPNLDALLAGGAYFKNAWTTYPFTLMAFASVFSGVYASATDQFRYREAGLWRNPWPPHPTIASILRSAGWRTEAVVGFPRWVKETQERESGFEFFNAQADPRARDRELDASEVTTLAIDALDRDPARPFFLWVHYFDPHAPYAPPLPHPFGDAPADLYDAEIQYADRELGRLLEALRARQLLAGTAIVFFSDHGEDLVEFDHGTALTEIQIHVPVAVALPRIPAREVGLAVDLTDLAPTILDLVGLPRPSRFHGQSLLPCVLLGEDRGAESLPPDLAFCELGGARLPQARQFAARTGSMKIICHADSQTCEIFDLSTDPGERRDLSSASPENAVRLRRVVDSVRALIAATPENAASRPDSRAVPK